MSESPPNQITLWKIRHLKKKGIVDPNVDLFIGVLDNDPAAVQAALEAGADVSITDNAVVAAHRLDLADFDPKDWQ
jgi:hypothetical protein